MRRRPLLPLWEKVSRVARRMRGSRFRWERAGCRWSSKCIEEALRALATANIALAVRILALFACLIVSGAARADALDDTLARFLDDKFPQSEKAVGELAAEAPPQAAAILDALGDNRLLIDPADHIVAYKTAAGTILNAKTGATIPAEKAPAFKKVRVNNALRFAIQGAMGSLTLANSDPQKRLAAAEDVAAGPATPRRCRLSRRNSPRKAIRMSPMR